MREITNSIDKFIKKYSCVILDEVHERSLDTDILIGIIKKLMNYPGCKTKFIIMSATFDVKKYAEFLGVYGSGDENQQNRLCRGSN